MAWLNTHFYSKALGLTCTMDVILPEADQGIGVGDAVWDGVSPLPVLYLLHGMSDDHTIWMRRTSLDRYAAGKTMAIVMPAVHRSMYSNQKYGYDFLKFAAEEVPAVCRRFFKISDKREDNFVAGLSMGGYGAMKIGLSYPDRFSHVASLSGALDYLEMGKTRPYNKISDIASMEKLRKDDPKTFSEIWDYFLCFGTPEEFAGSENDLVSLVEKRVKEGAELPKMHITIGTEDFLYPCNQTFRQKLDELKVDYYYEDFPGIHEWKVWDQKIQDVLAWLPVSSQKPTGNETQTELLKKEG